MPRFYKRSYKSSPRDKYSVEQRAGEFSLAAEGSQDIVIVPPSDLQGMRKVKHMTVSLAETLQETYVFWALVYVPQGTSPGALSVTAGPNSMYEPNQYVLNCGVADFKAGPVRIGTPLSRNLNSGDAIYLLIKNTTGKAPYIGYTVRYAITLQ